MVEMRFENGKNSHFVHRVTCSVHVDRDTGHMLGWGQRIATWTGVESSSEYNFTIPAYIHSTLPVVYNSTPH